MRNFHDIIALAAERHGGIEALEAALRDTPVLSPAEIAATPDDRILAAMTRRVFYAGFSSKVIDAKWDAFEAAFDRFDPGSCAAIAEEGFDAILRNKDIVRNGAKIASVRLNAAYVVDLAMQHGSAARFFADWPDDTYVALLETLKQRGNRLGGETGMRFLRDIRKAAVIPTRDVVAALVREGIPTGPPGGKRDFQAIQDACNTWSRECGRNLTEISRILAMSIGDIGTAHRRGH